jgi:two-component system response regulator YesN
MLGIVIVDDEAIVRMNLKSIIDWEKEGFVILGEAENGKKGMELIIREKPDIVISDIKMPVMDGLDMIRNVKKEYDGARYVVLSSYEEFGLLKTAMNYGVTDYLLKLELTQESLRQTLEALKKSILFENTTPQDREISPYSKVAQILRRVLAGYYVSEELGNTLTQANKKIDTARLSCIAVRFSLIRKTLGEGDRRTLEMAAHSIINNIVKQYFEGISFLEDAGFCLFVYSPGKNKGRIEEMCRLVINMLRQYLNLDAAAGISSLEGGAEIIHQIMIDAIRATDEVFYKGFGVVIFSRDVREACPREDISAVYAWNDPFRRALELHRDDEIKKIFKTLRGFLSPPLQVLLKKPEDGERPRPVIKLSRAAAFELCFSLVSVTLSVIRDYAAGEGVFNENLYEHIGKIETLEGLREWLDSFEWSILEWFTSIQENSRDDQIVAAAKCFAVENIHKPVSLNDTAAHLAISAGYLSSLFKRCTGLGFVEYVTRIKIKEAEKLLCSGKYRIGEISEMVGYEDTGYFSKIFHKLMGLSPKEYKSRHI